MSPDLTQSLESALGVKVRGSSRVSGGCIHQALRLESNQGSIFVKCNTAQSASMFAEEAHGLEAIRNTLTLRTPQALGAGIAEDDTAWLALEWIESSVPADEVAFGRRFANSLANLHRDESEHGYGHHRDGYIGSLPQINTWASDWGSFYRDHRLGPQIELAEKNGWLSGGLRDPLRRVLDCTERLLNLDPEPPSLIHGDLWSGNYLASGEGVVVIDPSVHYANREVELAFIELFGGFPQGFMDAYQDAYPLPKGYAGRRPLHQLYPLLVHLNLFGSSYAGRVWEAAQQTLSLCRAVHA